MAINYSIIIPHKNIPHLLQRCLDSIPNREDVEIIIVDDNSDTSKVDFNHFPGLERFDTVAIFDKSGMGAGHARNIGLGKAQGKWILFADADDFFNYCIRDAFDDYKDDEEHDVVFFNASSQDCFTYVNSERSIHLVQYIAEYQMNPQLSERLLRYSFGEPWAKLVKRSLISNNMIMFEETLIHNDTRFSYLVGFYGNKVKIDERALYCVTYRPTSISYVLDEERILTRFKVQARRAKFLQDHGIVDDNEHFIIDTFLALKSTNNLRLYQEGIRLYQQFGLNQIENQLNHEANRRRRGMIRSKIYAIIKSVLHV